MTFPGTNPSSPQHLRRRSNEVLLESSKELPLLGECLVSTVTELGGGIDPLEVDLLEGLAGCVDVHGFAEGDDSLLDTRDGALEEEEVVVDRSVADEATHTRVAVR